MAVDGRRKGSNYENKIAKLFGEAFGMEFRRTPLSGGWAKGNPGVAGDLVCMDMDPGDFLWHIECKNAEGWKLESLFTSKHKWFDDWWDQAVRECPDGKSPVLVFSRAYIGDFAACRLCDFGAMPTGTHIKTLIDHQLLVILPLDYFLDIESSMLEFEEVDDG